jgi:hypothetical protein
MQSNYRAICRHKQFTIAPERNAKQVTAVQSMDDAKFQGATKYDSRMAVYKYVEITAEVQQKPKVTGNTDLG